MMLLSLLLAIQLPAKPAVVYTTAESTSFRLTPTDTLMFKPSEPASEGKVYVFVDPRKRFQPLIGIAETIEAHPGFVHERQVKAAHFPVRPIEVIKHATGANLAAASSQQDDGQLIVVVAAGHHARAVENHRVVEQRSAPF